MNHLLQHTGGWDRDAPGIDDLTYKERTIASQMGVPSPPGRDLTLNWILGEPLHHDPGTTYAYSNIGYMALGMIVEKYSGKKHIDFLREDVMASANSSRSIWFMPARLRSQSAGAVLRQRRLEFYERLLAGRKFVAHGPAAIRRFRRGGPHRPGRHCG